MTNIRSLLLLALLALIAASGCDNGSSPAGDGNNGNGDGGNHKVDSSFALFYLEQDTLYWSETCIVHGRGLGTDKQLVQVYLGSQPAMVVSVTDTAVTFTVRENAVTGSIRFYRNDSLADGKVTLTVVRQSFHAQPHIINFGPKAGYEGEQLLIYGENLNLRDRDVVLTIGGANTVGGARATLDSFSPEMIFARIPRGATSGSVTMTFRNQNLPLGQFELLEHPQANVFEQAFRSVVVSTDLIMIMDQVELNTGDRSTLFREGEIEWRTSVSPTAKPQFVGDSLLFDAVTTIDLDTVNVQCRLLRDVSNSTLSGIVNVRHATKSASSLTHTIMSGTFRLDSLYYREDKNGLQAVATPLQSRDRISIQKLEWYQYYPQTGPRIATLTSPLDLLDPSLSRNGAKISLSFLK